MGGALAGCGVPSLDPHVLTAAAQGRTGLEDFGNDHFREPFRILTWSLACEARLNPVGRFLVRAQLVTLLANRLRMQHDWTRHPEILDRPVRAPLIIVGLPRAGGTIIHHLLSMDPANRCLLHWEAVSPSPPPQRSTYETDARRRRARRTLGILYRMAPAAWAIQPQEAHLPTECISLLAHSFASAEFPIIHRVPSFQNWWLGADLSSHYAYYRRQLQLLQWRCAGERWVLKSPAHLFALDVLLQTFPDALIVHLHRDPLEILASFCSMVAALRGVGTDTVDLREIGASWSEAWGIALERALLARQRAGSARILDLLFEDVAGDPVAAVRRICGHFGLPLDATTQARMRQLADHRAGRRSGRQGHCLEQFGLDAKVEGARFAGYVEAYGLRKRGLP